MKFKTESYYKHKNCLDAFICVERVVMDTGSHALISVFWMIQGIHNHWIASAKHARYLIKPVQYENWVAYEPKGEIL